MVEIMFFKAAMPLQGAAQKLKYRHTVPTFRGENLTDFALVIDSARAVEITVRISNPERLGGSLAELTLEWSDKAAAAGNVSMLVDLQHCRLFSYPFRMISVSSSGILSIG